MCSSLSAFGFDGKLVLRAREVGRKAIGRRAGVELRKRRYDLGDVGAQWQAWLDALTVPAS